MPVPASHITRLEFHSTNPPPAATSPRERVIHLKDADAAACLLSEGANPRHLPLCRQPQRNEKTPSDNAV